MINCFFLNKGNNKTKIRFVVTWGKLAEHLGSVNVIANVINLKLEGGFSGVYFSCMLHSFHIPFAITKILLIFEWSTEENSYVHTLLKIGTRLNMAECVQKYWKEVLDFLFFFFFALMISSQAACMRTGGTATRPGKLSGRYAW